MRILLCIPSPIRSIVLSTTLEEAYYKDYESYECEMEMLLHIRSKTCTRDVLIIDSSCDNLNPIETVRGVRLYYPEVPVINIVKNADILNIAQCKEVVASDPEMLSKIVKQLHLYEVSYALKKLS